MEILESFLLFFILGLDLSDDGPDATDVVCKGDTAESLDKDKGDGLNLIWGRNVPETHGQHNVRPPIITPDIFCGPFWVLYAHLMVPTIFTTTQLSHKVQKYRQNVSDRKVKKEDLNQRPILLPGVCFDINKLEAFKSFEIIFKFK